MKTPWKFVADLVSRKSKPHSHDKGPAVEANTIALEYKPISEEDQPPHDETAVDRSAESGSDAQVDMSLLEPDAVASAIETEAPVAAALAVAAGLEEPAALPTSQQPEEEGSAPMQTEAAETLLKPEPARRRKVKPIAEPAASTNQTDDVAPAVAVGSKSFTDEMADLDTEVDALRRQLAKKLIEQNAQLRKMLARFDGRSPGAAAAARKGSAGGGAS